MKVVLLFQKVIMKKTELVKYMDEYLCTKDFDDPWFINTLEVDSQKSDIKKIGYAVDCTTYIIDKAIKENVDMLLVHHGLHFNQALTGLHYERVRKLMDNDICLYTSHVPLDAHPVLGNNAVLVQEFAKFFAIKNFKKVPFGEDHGVFYGFAITFKEKVATGKLKDFCKHVGIEYNFRNYGNKQYIQSLAVVTGSANDVLIELFGKKYDLYITGELKHSSYYICKEMKQCILPGWHYETEVFGVRAFAQHLEKKCKIKTVFLDEKY